MILDHVPAPDDVSTGWWDATREHRLTLQQCAACQAFQHPPRAVCTTCSSMEHLTLVDAAGTGVVDSFTVIHRGPRPEVEVPYTIARVRLTEGPVLLTQLVGADPGAWSIDAPVSVAWADLADGRALPVFTPSSDLIKEH